MPSRGEAMKAARIERGLYKCALCSGTFGNKEIRVDHIVPIVNPQTGFTTWDDYINKLFCPAVELQIICLICNTSKTQTENQLRKIYRQKNKKDTVVVKSLDKKKKLK